MQAITNDGAAHGRAELLIRVWQDPVENEVLGVELVVPEIAAQRTRERVGARLGDGIHHHTGRSPLRRVEAVGDDLELGNRVATDLGLLAVGGRVIVCRDLLAVDVGLGVALAVLHEAAAHELASHLDARTARVDVGAHGRPLRVDERRLARDGDGLGERRRTQLQCDRQCLVQQQLQPRAGGGLKT